MLFLFPLEESISDIMSYRFNTGQLWFFFELISPSVIKVNVQSIHSGIPKEFNICPAALPPPTYLFPTFLTGRDTDSALLILINFRADDKCLTRNSLKA